MFYVYFAQSFKTGKVYVGSTNKLPELRVIEHNQGTNTWSKTHKPLKLIYFESYHCKKDALHRESFYKSGFGRKIKQAIIDGLTK